MSGGLSAFEKRLLNLLQTGLPIVERPYIKIGRALGVDEQTALKATRELLKKGVIRRIGAVINWRAAGKASTLVTAFVPEKKLKKVVAAVNHLEGVSHNYLREHPFNLWFTLRADSQSEIRTTLAKLSKRFALDFHSLPVQRTFKLDVRFDAQSGGRRLLPGYRTLNAERSPRRSRSLLAEGEAKPGCSLNAIDKQILERLQGGVNVVAKPFDFLGKDEFENYDCLLHIAGMLEEGIIYRIGAVVNHHKLGFVANAMFVCKVSGAAVVDIGQKLAKLKIVSHCYQRKPFAGWPYNLYAMMHGRRQTDIRRVVEKFVKSQGLEKWELLATEARLLNHKNQRVL
ncbi:MAG: hypothetical protein ABII09_12310 [Planctomycetota bacterium]